MGSRFPVFRKTRVVVLVFATVLTTGCATGVIVRSEGDPGANLAAYRTFAFFDRTDTDGNRMRTSVARTLMMSVRREMEVRGYRYVPAAGELRVDFNIRLADRTEFFSRPIPADEYYSFRNGDSWRTRELDAEQYKEGTLRIDIIDVARKRMVWEGIAIGRVTGKVRQNSGEAIDEAVRDIFAKYPVPASVGRGLSPSGPTRLSAHCDDRSRTMSGSGAAIECARPAMVLTWINTVEGLSVRNIASPISNGERK